MQQEQAVTIPAEFYYKVVERKVTDETGQTKTVYVDEPRIKFRVDNHSYYERKVREEDKLARPNQWAAFSRDGTLEYDGVPLSQAPFMTPATIKNLNFMGIYTVEQLASIPESQLSGLMGGIDFKTKAQAFVSAQKGMVDVNGLAKKLQELTDTVAIQAEENKELKQLLARAEAERKEAEAAAKAKPSKSDKPA